MQPPRMLKIMKKDKMKKFKQKLYTIQEGHYTGPKDLEKIPSSLEVIGKTTIGGAAIGGTVNGILKEAGVINDASIISGASTGGKTGFLAGIAAKLLLNALHKPMKSVKYQEVDKLLRAKFGIYRVSGFVTGDTRERRKAVEEKFGFNDRKVTDYRISFVIRDNQVTMYTLGISDDILDKLNGSLDYYCKKYSGMDYNSKPINVRSNSYSITITFTNYKAISDFIYEISEETNLKINLLDNDVLLKKEENEEFQKEYSLYLDKYDITRIAAKSGVKALGAMVNGPRYALSYMVSGMLKEGFKTLRDQEVSKLFPSARKNFGSSYLIDRIKELGGIEGMTFTLGEKNCPLNIRLDQGLFMVTVLQNTKEEKIVSSIFSEDTKKEIKGKVSLWVNPISSRRDFDIILEKLLTSESKPNIFV